MNKKYQIYHDGLFFDGVTSTRIKIKKDKKKGENIYSTKRKIIMICRFMSIERLRILTFSIIQRQIKKRQLKAMVRTQYKPRSKITQKDTIQL